MCIMCVGSCVTCVCVFVCRFMYKSVCRFMCVSEWLRDGGEEKGEGDACVRKGGGNICVRKREEGKGE